MGILLCEQNFRDVWRRNKSVGQKFVKCCAHTHKHTHAAKLVVRITMRVPVQRAALCIQNFPSQYRNHFRGLSGHDAGSFNATVFISMLSGGRAGVSINSPAAANTSLL